MRERWGKDEACPKKMRERWVGVRPPLGLLDLGTLAGSLRSRRRYSCALHSPVPYYSSLFHSQKFLALCLCLPLVALVGFRRCQGPKEEYKGLSRSGAQRQQIISTHHQACRTKNVLTIICCVVGRPQ